MTRVLGVNDNNDIYLSATGRLVIISDLDAVMQACESACRAQLGEMIYAKDKGIPMLDSVWSGTLQLGIFEDSIRTAIAGVPNVIAITDFNASQTGEVLQYTATIQTTFGTGTING
jgi:hypothetical protein